MNLFQPTRIPYQRPVRQSTKPRRDKEHTYIVNHFVGSNLIARFELKRDSDILIEELLFNDLED